jgi:hypothetical protein
VTAATVNEPVSGYDSRAALGERSTGAPGQQAPRGQLIEREGWAVTDAEMAERIGPAGASPLWAP